MKCARNLEGAKKLVLPKATVPPAAAAQVPDHWLRPDGPCEGRRTLGWEQTYAVIAALEGLTSQDLREIGDADAEDAAADYRLESLTPTTATTTPSGTRPSSASGSGSGDSHFPFRTSAATVNLAGGHDDMNIFVKELKSGDPSTTYFYLILVTLTPPHY